MKVYALNVTHADYDEEIDETAIEGIYSTKEIAEARGKSLEVEEDPNTPKWDQTYEEYLDGRPPSENEEIDYCNLCYTFSKTVEVTYEVIEYTIDEEST